MTGTVFLARHGQTVSNAEGRYQGRLDSPLTLLGCEQARTTAEAMRACGIERLLCSPLGRARQTASVAAEALGLPVEVDAELTESDLGRWEGLTRQEVGRTVSGRAGPAWRGPSQLSPRRRGVVGRSVVAGSRGGRSAR